MHPQVPLNSQLEQGFASGVECDLFAVKLNP